MDEKMMEDDEITAKELKKILAEHGHHVGETTALKCRTELGWTWRGSAYCQMIREVTRLSDWNGQKRTKEMTFQTPSSPMKLQCK